MTHLETERVADPPGRKAPSTATAGAGSPAAAATAAALERPRIVVAVSHPMTVRILLRGQLAFLREHGFDVAVLAPSGEELVAAAKTEGVRVLPVPMTRRMTPLRDLVALRTIVGHLRRERPHLVHASTPKAGLLGMLAARLAGTPARLYLVRGLRLETASGLARRVLGLSERLSSACADSVVCVSPSLRRRYAELGLAPSRKLHVLAHGSSNGIDAGRFAASSELACEVKRLRGELGLPPAAPVVGFVGRLTRDKGISELVAAYLSLREGIPDLRLLLVGDFEAEDPLAADLRRFLDEDPACCVTGFVDDPAPYYHLMTVHAQPSYREGFPNAPLEAGAAGIPTVGFAATGTVDAVIDGQTGLLAPTGDAAELARLLERYLRDDDLRRRHGDAARQRVLRDFAPERVWIAMAAELDRLLIAARRRRPLWWRAARRGRDVVVAGLGLLLTAPLLLVIAALVRVTMGPPVLFRQRRPGLEGRPFLLYKFRTMKQVEEDGRANREGEDAGRITRFGAFLRRTSLDELPELLNVLRGDMSLVGPRPLLLEYLPLYTTEQARRHDVEPGITGWAQVKGRNALSWEEKFALDVWYVDHRTLWLDTTILFMTVIQVVRGGGISAEGHATMPKFRGAR